MNAVKSVALARDCQAVQIPQGTQVNLPRGLAVEITQTLGGTYTIHAQGNLYRIADKDADALGISPAPMAFPAAAAADSARLSEDQVWKVLKNCYDPEIPVNIVDLGLIYDLRLQKLPTGLHRVDIKMTLTAPGCGMGAVIASDAQQKLLQLEGVEEATVELVWDPPWHPSMISPEGRRSLGMD